ncbi:sulfatase [Candidatus Hydrogenedentota bacterium]
MNDKSKPNILFIMADQYRHDYLGSAGAAFLRTPNLDKLAERGVRMSHCITNAPVCVPARIALATGMQPQRYGSLDNLSFMPASATTLYQRFRDHGYRVGCVGKLDLAKPYSYNGRYGDRPCVFGFGFTHPEECEGKMAAGGKPEPKGPYGFYLQEKGLYRAFHEDYVERKRNGWVKNASHDSPLPAEDFEDAYIGSRAAKWIENVPDDFPWHYFVSFVGPHDPFDPPTEYADRYRDAEMPRAIPADMTGKPGWVKNRVLDMSEEEVTVTRRQYCAAIELIDDQVGLIIEALENRGMLDNTYIVFTSDHGEMLGDHGVYTKEMPYEASIRVPLLVAGPGIEGARTSNALVELIDVNPTVCELAGLPAQENIDAKSFEPVLSGESNEHRPDVISILRSFMCIRTERYKLVQSPNDISELYDLENDPDELQNIFEQEPEIARDLCKRFWNRCLEDKWLR